MVEKRSEPVANAAGAIEQMLQRQLGTRIRRLRVSIEPNGLVISGRCRSYHDKQMAQHLAADISRLKVAENRIEVDSTVASQTRPAGRLVRSRLALTPIPRTTGDADEPAAPTSPAAADVPGSVLIREVHPDRPDESRE